MTVEWLMWLPALGRWWITHLPGLLLGTGVLALLALAADHVLARHVSAGARVWLHFAVFVRLALPDGWSMPIGLLSVPGQVSDTELDHGRVVVESIASPSPLTAPGSLLMGGLYLLIAVLLSVHWLRARFTVQRLIDESKPASEVLLASLPWEKGWHEGTLRVLVHPTAGPLVAGAWGAVIVLPERIAVGPACARACVFARAFPSQSRRGEKLL